MNRLYRWSTGPCQSFRDPFVSGGPKSSRSSTVGSRCRSGTRAFPLGGSHRTGRSQNLSFGRIRRRNRLSPGRSAMRISRIAASTRGRVKTGRVAPVALITMSAASRAADIWSHGSARPPIAPASAEACAKVLLVISIRWASNFGDPSRFGNFFCHRNLPLFLSVHQTAKTMNFTVPAVRGQ